MKNIFLHLGFLFIMFGISIIFIDQVSASINEYYDDVNKSNEIIDEVGINYSLFREKTLIIKDKIVDVSKSFNIFLDDFLGKNVEILEKVNDVEKEINSLSDTTNDLINYCQYELNNNVMNTQCSSFKTNFTNMINSYEEMIKVYNDVIDTYNNYSIQNDLATVDNYVNGLNTSIMMANAKLK